MVTKYVQSWNEQKTVFIGRVCSCCGSPVLSRVVAQAYVAEGFWFRAHISEAQQKKRIAGRKAVAETIREIEICKRDHTAISRTPHPDDRKSYRVVQETTIQGINDTCPNCFSAEPWMPERLSDKKLEQLGEESFPTVFQSDTEARQWALDWVAKMVSRVQATRQSSEAIAAAQAEVQTLKAAIDALEEQRRSLGLQEKKAALEQERAAHEAQRYEIGLLDIPGRRAYRDAERMIEYRIRELEEELQEVCKPIDDQLADYRVALQKAMGIAEGHTDRVLVCMEGTSCSLHPELAGDWSKVYPNAQVHDAREGSMASECWAGQHRKTGSRFQLPETRFEGSDLVGIAPMIVFSIMFLIGYLQEAVNLFQKGFGPLILLAFVLVVAMGTVDYLYLAKTNATRKKYAGVFCLLLISALLLTVSIAGLILAVRDGLQTQLVLSAVATAAILLTALLIYLKMRGVKLSKLRLFTKKTAKTTDLRPKR